MFHSCWKQPFASLQNFVGTLVQTFGDPYIRIWNLQENLRNPSSEPPLAEPLLPPFCNLSFRTPSLLQPPKPHFLEEHFPWHLSDLLSLKPHYGHTPFGTVIFWGCVVVCCCCCVLFVVVVVCCVLWCCVPNPEDLKTWRPKDLKT